MLCRVRGGAFAQERKAPQPLPQVRPQAKEQRRVLAREPLQHFERRGGVGPRLGVRHRDLAAVGERRFHAGGVASLEHAHLVAGLAEKPGGGDADDAGAKDEDFHDGLLFKGWREKAAFSRRSLCPLRLPST
jgi:hypothetical protein